ncbi:Z1 domain-containing protein [Allocoleopsis franciscana]|uniref:Z1 domain-containing protein n=1 Tax=Allocoleopsis franciscana PCC 7113 TaxID=1173027 RepID=K9WI63_9CYAN|nr:Z1 domain-containing protein [Allocoleopsis franciscana]AFZ19207.1 Z1 domain-containing protein [Allocoleopsis franciscana PCC 7113]
MNDYDMARQLAQVMLKVEPTPTREIIQEKVRVVLSMLGSQRNHAVEVDEEKLVRELQSLFNTWIGIGTILDNQEDHIHWLPDRNSEIIWDFWDRYRRYLEEEKGWAPATIDSVDRLTNSVLERLEDPQRPGAWDRRGMVVGQVQSGKTANYTGLICKAVDAGYKLIIVLAGMQNSLRSQTQLRLDEGFLGFDSQVNRAFDRGNSFLGVGKIPIGKWLVANSATSSANNGDFNRRVVNSFGVHPGGKDPLLLVVKKNKSILTNLFKWALSVRGIVHEESGRKIVRDVPILIIDDEADNASINTNPLQFDESGNLEEDHEISAINKLIRQLLYSFEKSAYVGYTATPFANIFIYPDVTTPECGEDLFPRSFIINLPTPSNYIGPAQVFGLDVDQTSSLEASEGLPIIRLVDDHESWMPNKHKKDHVPDYLPWSLKKAIRAFILACAMRMARGQENEHNSMLVHVTRYANVQSEVTEQVRDELASLKRRLRYGDGNALDQVLREFEQLWTRDFLPTTQAISDTQLQPVSWEEVKPLLKQVVSKIQVKKINGTAKDVLDYWEYKNGLSVIAIGGNKLSRGLTLEGLTVSYYLRASKMYDTLMQMGRWFGYRPGYLDVCRLYTTDDLVEWYKHITIASEELRQEFDYMADSGGTPEDFGLKVRTHPQGLMITGANKMKTGTKMELSFAGSISETTIFYKDNQINQRNFEATEELLKNLGAYIERENDNYIWKKVSFAQIIDFLSGYESHPKSRVAKTSLLTQYIKAQRPLNELVSWTVILISSQRPKNRASIAGYGVGLIERQQADSSTAEYRLKKSRLLSPTDEWLDLPQPTRDAILDETRHLRELAGKPPSSSKTPNGKVIRSKRLPRNGLLLLYPLDPAEIESDFPVIGFAVSFPNSPTARRIEYQVNNVYWEQEFGEI